MFRLGGCLPILDRDLCGERGVESSAISRTVTGENAGDAQLQFGNGHEVVVWGERERGAVVAGGGLVGVDRMGLDGSYGEGGSCVGFEVAVVSELAA